MNSPIDDKLEILSLSNEEFADGLARMVKLFTSSKESKSGDKLFKPSSSFAEAGNAILLEDNTPLLGG